MWHSAQFGHFWKNWQSGLPGPARSFTQCVQVYRCRFNAHTSLWRKAQLPYPPSITCLSSAAWTLPSLRCKSEDWRGGKVIKSPCLSFWLEEIQLLKSSYWNLSLLPFSSLCFRDRLWFFFKLLFSFFFFFPLSTKPVFCSVYISVMLMQNAGIRLTFTLFSFWENYFLLHLLWMLTPFLFTALLGHIPVLFCSLT